MTIIADKLVKLVESTGLQKASTTQHLEVDAQDPSFVTTRPYFEPSSTGISLDNASSFLNSAINSNVILILKSQLDHSVQSARVELRAASPDDDEGLLFFPTSSRSHADLIYSTALQVSRPSQRFPHFLPMSIATGDAQSCCVATP